MAATHIWREHLQRLSYVVVTCSRIEVTASNGSVSIRLLSIFQSPNRMEEGYVLELRTHKWYVGKTTDLQRRYAEHQAGNGCEWTKHFPPVRIADHTPRKQRNH